MTRVRSLLALAGGLAITAGLLTGCAGPIDFSADSSVHITTPSPLSVVSLPMTVHWDAPPGRYAVFVDQAPISPGRTLRQLAGKACQGKANCPGAAYLQTIGVYVSSTGHVVIPGVPVLGSTNGHEPHPTHTLVLVRIDGGGRRVGAAYWESEFRV